MRYSVIQRGLRYYPFCNFTLYFVVFRPFFLSFRFNDFKKPSSSPSRPIIFGCAENPERKVSVVLFPFENQRPPHPIRKKAENGNLSTKFLENYGPIGCCRGAQKKKKKVRGRRYEVGKID